MLKTSLNKIKKKKATSLLEVMVSLAIMAVAIISSVSLAVKASIEIKTNEINQIANAQLIDALEASKSPSGVYVDNVNLNWATSLNQTTYFGISKPNTNYILHFDPSAQVELTKLNCASPYLSKVSGVVSCIQVAVTPLKDISNSFNKGNIYYQIKVILVYISYNQTNLDFLSTYRYQNFCLTTSVC